MKNRNFVIRKKLLEDVREVYYHLEGIAENLGIPADNVVLRELYFKDVKLSAFPFNGKSLQQFSRDSTAY